MKHEKKRRLPLFWRLMASIMACWFVLLAATLGVTMRYALNTFQEKIDNILMSTVVTLANSPSIQRGLERGSYDQEMKDYLLDVVVNTEDMEYITIADTNSIRLFQIDPAYIGLPFAGGDEQRALAGESYLSDATPLNVEGQRRAFHPVYGGEGQVIGFVMASTSHDRIDALRSDIYSTYVSLFLILTLCTLIFSGALAVYLGQNLRGVRPEDMIRMYLTQNDMLNALNEGLVSFDNTGKVRLVNAAAAKMLDRREDLLVGQQVDDLIRAADGSSLREWVGQGCQSNLPNILVQPVQLPDSNLWARRVLVLADQSEISRYAEELGGTRHMLNTMRSNTHEFLNKLQVISGLLQMGRTEEAQCYIGSISAAHERIVGPVMRSIRNTSVAALVLGKEGNMRELGINLVIMSNSDLPERSRYLSTNELVTVLGNLLENAIEATNANPPEDLRAVVLQLTEDEKGLLIMVSDTGVGIDEENLPHIFEPGFSTKASTGRGVGMSLVREIIDRHGGAIDVDTEPGSGTTFTIIFSRERGENL